MVADCWPLIAPIVHFERNNNTCMLKMKRAV